jgi:hypothetical protein
MIAFLVVVYLGAVFGPPPPSVRVLEVTALFTWILVPWTAWIGRNRRVVTAVT